MQIYISLKNKLYSGKNKDIRLVDRQLKVTNFSSWRTKSEVLSWDEREKKQTNKHRKRKQGKYPIVKRYQIWQILKQTEPNTRP